MKLLRKNNVQRELHPFIVRVLIRSNNTLKLWADWLQKKTDSYSTGKTLIILGLFCLCFVTGTVVVVERSFRKYNLFHHSVTLIKPIQLLNEKSYPLISEREFNKIHRLKFILDSLQTNSKIEFDSLLSLRPHLIDTIHLLENLYYEQQKNKP